MTLTIERLTEIAVELLEQDNARKDEQIQQLRYHLHCIASELGDSHLDFEKLASGVARHRKEFEGYLTDIAEALDYRGHPAHIAKVIKTRLSTSSALMKDKSKHWVKEDGECSVHCPACGPPCTHGENGLECLICKADKQTAVLAGAGRFTDEQLLKLLRLQPVEIAIKVIAHELWLRSTARYREQNQPIAGCAVGKHRHLLPKP